VKVQPIGPFVGINNRLPDHLLSIVERGRKAGDYLRNAVNVDLTASGSLQRRKGSTLTQAGTDCHSLWGENDRTFYADGTTLYEYPRTVVRTGLTPGMRISYTFAPSGDIYWTNGIVLERISGSASGPASLPTPNPQPTVTASAGGSFKAGQYQVCITAVGPDGEESGATWPVQVSVPDSGRIEITNLPGSLVSIYLSSQNGDVLFHAVTISASSYILPLMPTLGVQLQTLGLRPMPAGQIVRYFNGRVLVASDNTLYIGEPYAGALYNPAKGYVPLPARVTLLEPADNGVYLVADKTYWLAGKDPDKAELREVLPYGAVEGTGGRMEAGNDVWWFSTRGVVVGNEAGEVNNIQEETVSVEAAQTGATLYREQDGMRQLVSSLFGTDETNRAAAASYIDAEVVRKENML
jgi:hypothetical protein